MYYVLFSFLWDLCRRIGEPYIEFRLRKSCFRVSRGLGGGEGALGVGPEVPERQGMYRRGVGPKSSPPAQLRREAARHCCHA